MARKKSKATQGGIQIGGNLDIGNGDVVGGDKITHNNQRINVEGDGNNVTQLDGDENTVSQQITLREEKFQDVFKKIEERPNTSAQEKEDLKTTVEVIKTEAERIETETENGNQPDEKPLGRYLRIIAGMAPDIFEVVTATLISPAVGFGVVVKKIAEQAHKGHNAAAA